MSEVSYSIDKRLRELNFIAYTKRRRHFPCKIMFQDTPSILKIYKEKNLCFQRDQKLGYQKNYLE